MSSIKELQEDKRLKEKKQNRWEVFCAMVNYLKWAFGLALFAGITIVSLASLSGLYSLLIIVLGGAGMYATNELANFIEKGPIANYNIKLNNINRQINDIEGQKGAVPRQRVEMQFAPTPKKTTTSGEQPKYSYDNALSVNVAETPELSSGGTDIPSYLAGNRSR